MTFDRERAMQAVSDFLAAVGVDPQATEMRRTPERVVDLAEAAFAQAGTDPAHALGTPIDAAEDETAGQLVAVQGVRFRSVCPHHLLPFEGTADVTYAPGAHLAGFSRVVSLVTVTAARPQLQERMGEQIAEALMSVLKPRGVSVRIQATHGCVEALEPAGRGTQLVTLCRRGELDVSAELASPAL